MGANGYKVIRNKVSQVGSSQIIKGFVCHENDFRFYSVAAEKPLKNIEQQSNIIMYMLEPLSWQHYGA